MVSQSRKHSQGCIITTVVPGSSVECDDEQHAGRGGARSDNQRLAGRISCSSSRLLLPLSYASILGGMCTLIGTSTNLIVADLNQQAIADGIGTESLHFFSPAAVGLPATLLGLIYMIIASPATSKSSFGCERIR